MDRSLGVIIIFTILGLISISAQAPDTLWTRTYGGLYGDMGLSVQQTADGGYIIGGITQADSGAPMQIYLIKTDSVGGLIWERVYAGVLSFNGGDPLVQQTKDGGYIITGGRVDSTGKEKVYLLKTSATGDSLWAKILGGYSGGTAVRETKDGGYVITGATYIRPSSAVYLVKTNSQGDSVWANSYNWIFDDKGYSVHETKDGGYIITGYSETEDLYEVYLVKTNGQGDSIWAKTYGGIMDDIGFSVQETSDGGYIIVGRTWSFGSGGLGIYLIKTDDRGNQLWWKKLGGPMQDVGYTIRVTSDGGYIIGGWTTSYGAGRGDFYLIKTDSLGTIIWTKTIGGPDQDKGFSATQTSDGGYIIVGWTSSYGAGMTDVYLVKLGADIGIKEELPIRLKENQKILKGSNFFRNKVTLSFGSPTMDPLRINLYNACGASVYNCFYRDTPAIFSLEDLKNLSSGIYFLSIQSGPRCWRIKLVKP